MSDNVVQFSPRGSELLPDAVLKQSLGQFEDVLVIGWTPDGPMAAAWSGFFMSGQEMLWILEKFKLSLLAGEFEE